ncbi:MAG TPA: nicotinate phosphoribosyltransferase [Steroidobacteraceae bacterium]|nr:nicotinate phosphoribosyltransferase [Steroidobacteraceae bacterium]
MNTIAGGAVTAPPLLTDLYQLTMLDAYYRLVMNERAVFEFSVRRLPHARNFLVAAGLEQVLDYLENLRFSDDDIEWLASLKRFSPEFLAHLRDFRFTGEVYALREGTVFFGSEPVLRVVAPLPQAQLVESRIVNLLQYQILVASKAARCRLAAPSKQLVDFGMRRAHGAEAGILCSRASYIAGFDATATLEAARQFGIPPAGTMAHSFVQAHEIEVMAFSNFATCHPQNVVLLIDTYDIARGARRAAQVAKQLRTSGTIVKAVRIDSGDLSVEARRVRDILDSHGEREIQIVASSSLDEYAIAALEAEQVPIDTYCVGTKLAVSEDAPSLDCAYKLQQYAGRFCRKRSQWKETWPGERQVYRQYDPQGYIARDVLCCAHEVNEGSALLHRVMCNGRRMAHSPPLHEIRGYCKEQLATVPDTLRTLEHVAYTPAKVSDLEHALAAEVDKIAH